MCHVSSVIDRISYQCFIDKNLATLILGYSLPKTFATRRLYPSRPEQQHLLWVLFGMLAALLVISYIPALLEMASMTLSTGPAIASL